MKNSRLVLGAVVFGAAIGSAGIAMALSSDPSTTTTPAAVAGAPAAAPSAAAPDHGNTDPAHEAAESPEHAAEEASGNWHGGHGGHGGPSNHDAAHEAAESPERAAEEAAEDANVPAGATSDLTPGASTTQQT